jgi:hypothetical protein
VIKRLKQELGISLVEPQIAQVAGHKWFLRAPDYEDVEWIMGQIADGGTQAEFHATNQVATLAVSIIAIDGVPTYKLWGTDQLIKDAVIDDPLNPPLIIRHLAADRMLNFLRSDLWSVMVPLLWAEYITKIDARMAIPEAPFDSTTSEKPASPTNSSQAGESSSPEPDDSQPTMPRED